MSIATSVGKNVPLYSGRKVSNFFVKQCENAIFNLLFCRSHSFLYICRTLHKLYTHELYH